MSAPQTRRYRLFSREHGYFSGKVRACLRYEACGRGPAAAQPVHA